MTGRSTPLFVLSTFLLMFLISQTSKLSAQQLMCGDEILKSYFDFTYPGYLDVVDNTFEKARDGDFNSFRDETIFTIPVVVHVVWKEEEENLHDTIIFNQIQVLNEDYRRMNADTANTREIFHDRVGDAGIQFVLVDIIRTQTTEDFAPTLLSVPDKVKINAQGGSDALNTEKYLNIWICKLQPLTILGIPLGQVLGYAYPPADLENWPDGASAPSAALDGVVIDYRAVGPGNSNTLDPGTGQEIMSYGRTAVHEIGHYLGLRHIWGDVLFGNGCSQDDGIEDTPNQASASNFTCDHSRNTCIDDVDDLPDMVENYMDYSTDQCMNSFTFGQIAVMRAVLQGPRAGLLNYVAAKTTEIPKFSIYPNPSQTGVFLVESDYRFTTQKVLNVYNISGANVLSKITRDSETYLDLGNLPDGMYFLRIFDVDQQVQLGIQKLVKISD